MQYTSPKFTWTKDQEKDRRIFRKLVWCFANQLYYESLMGPLCSIINSNVSDHCGLLIDMQHSVMKVKVTFRFFNMWFEHPEIFKIVERIWKIPMSGNSMYKMYQRLKLLWVELRSLNRNNFNQLSGRTSKYRDDLEKIKGRLQADPFNETIQQEEKSMLIQMQEMLHWEESFLK